MASDDKNLPDENDPEFQEFIGFVKHLKEEKDKQNQPEEDKRTFGEKARDFVGDIPDVIKRGVIGTGQKAMEMGGAAVDAAMHPIDTVVNGVGAINDNLHRSQRLQIEHPADPESILGDLPLLGPVLNALPNLDSKVRVPLSLAASALIPGGGGPIVQAGLRAVAPSVGDLVGREGTKLIGRGENTSLLDDVQDEISNSGVNLLTEGGGKLLTKTGKVGAGVAERTPAQVKKILDPDTALTHAITNGATEEASPAIESFGSPRPPDEPIGAVVKREKNLLTPSPDADGNVFGPMRDNLRNEGKKLVDTVDRVQQSAIAASPNVKFKDLKLNEVRKDIMDAGMPEAAQNRALKIVNDEHRAALKETLTPSEYANFTQNERIYGRSSVKLSAVEDSLAKTPKTNLQQISDLNSQRADLLKQRDSAGRVLTAAGKKLDNSDVSLQHVLNMRREFDSFGQFDNLTDPAKRQVGIRAYRGIANKLRDAFNGNIESSLGPDALTKYQGSTKRLNDLSRLEEHANLRAGEEALPNTGANVLGDMKAGVTGDLGSLSPRDAFDLSQGKGTMAGFQAAQGAQAGIAKAVGAAAPLVTGAGRTLEAMAKVGAGAINQLVQSGSLDPATAQQYNTALTTGTPEEARLALGKVGTLAPQAFEPPAVPGIKSMVDGRVQDDLEIEHLVQQADKVYPTDLRSRLELKRALISKAPLSASQVKALGGQPPPMLKDSTDTFLEHEEGGQKLKGYVPGKSSGVTIGTGFDIGQHSVHDLRSLGFPPALIAKLGKYTERTGPVAKSLLKEKPLALTPEEAQTVDTIARQKTKEAVSSNYHTATGASLDAAPKNAQTVIHSLAFNFGPNLETKAPKMWKAIVDSDWEGLHHQLVNTKWKQPELKARRMREAALLEPLIPQKPEEDIFHYAQSGLSTVAGRVKLADGTVRQKFNDTAA